MITLAPLGPGSHRDSRTDPQVGARGLDYDKCEQALAPLPPLPRGPQRELRHLPNSCGEGLACPQGGGAKRQLPCRYRRAAPQGAHRAYCIQRSTIAKRWSLVLVLLTLLGGARPGASHHSPEDPAATPSPRSRSTRNQSLPGAFHTALSDSTKLQRSLVMGCTTRRWRREPLPG
eukprot:scaffold517_cov392-Prasinococcus_capsulatus_cf.AAC.6